MEFDIEYLSRKVIKGKAVADFLAQNLMDDNQEWELDFPDEHLRAIEVQGWRMYFDGAVNSKGVGVGVILITPEGEMIPMAKRLEFEVTNNQTEYEACIFRLEALRSAGAEEVTVYGDSMLVVKQVSKEWEVKEDRLRLYVNYLAIVTLSFNQCRFIHLPREDNQVADALATLASMWESGAKAPAQPLILVKSRSPCHEEIRVMPMGPVEKPWFYDLQKYLETGQFSEDADRKEKTSLKILSRQFISHLSMLYKRMPTGMHLRCVDKEEAQTIMEAMHASVCGSHMNGTVLAKKITR